MKKALLILAAVAVVLVAGFYTINAYIYNEKQADPNDIVSYRGTLEGEVVCLPHEGTDECALGLRTDVGEYYALDLALLSQEDAKVGIGARISANGLITPVEMLSADHWQTYDIEGIFSVTDSLKTL